MPPIRWRLLAAASLLLACCRPVVARPVPGGVIRVQTRSGSIEAGQAPLLRGLVYEHLTRYQESGDALEGELATAWKDEDGGRRWRFELRPGVKFHDGSALDPRAVAAILQPLHPAWRVEADGATLVITTSQPFPNLPQDLAEAAEAIARKGSDGLPVATGPFRVTHYEPGRLVTLAANEAHWLGRPFVAAIEIALNRPLREQYLDFELRRADLVELGPAEARRATQSGRTVTSSLPKQLLVLRLAERLDWRLRQALARSIDRASIHAVLLQRQGETTAALLPQWLSGYAFLFPTAPDPARARQLLAGSRPPAITLYADPADPTGRSIADRIAVNARDAGLTVHVITSGSHNADARLLRLPIDSLSPQLAFAQLALALGLKPPPLDSEIQTLATAEAQLLDLNLVVPLFHLPEAWAWSPRLRVWLRPPEGRDGSLHLADTWVLEERARP